MLHYLRVWLATARYSIIRSLMYRFDFILWSCVELFWMTVNVVLVQVIYDHTNSVAGWTKYEMLLLVGTSMLIQRFLMGFFWSSVAEMGRNIRTGHFDFFIAQPGNLLFMATTRKLDPDSLINSMVAIALVVFSARQLGLHPGAGDIALYALLVFCGIVIHFSALVIISALSFWTTGNQGIEGGYFTLFEFARLPREAFRGVVRFIFVWMLPVVVVSNVPASSLLHGFQPAFALWLAAITVLWFGVAVTVFNAGLRRYSSASS